MARRRKDWVKEQKLEHRTDAVQLVKLFADTQTERHEEPTRAGTPRGSPIGLSKNKMKAACLMTGYPALLSFAEIAEECRTTEGVIKVWRTEDEFCRVIAREGLELAQLLVNSIEDYWRQTVFYADSPGENAEEFAPRKGDARLRFDWKGGDPLEAHMALTRIIWTIPLLSLGEGDDLIVRYMTKKCEAGSYLHALLLSQLFEVLQVHDLASARRYHKQPKLLEVRKLIIGNAIDALCESSKSVEEKKQGAEGVKRAIFTLIDILASG